MSNYLTGWLVVGLILVAITSVACSDEPTPSPLPNPTATQAPALNTGATDTPMPVTTPVATPASTPMPATPVATGASTPTPAPTPTATPIPAAASDPPTWVFAGDVPDEHQTALREEMERVRGYFSNRFGVEGTDFTVLVGSDHGALSSVYHDVTGRDLSDSIPSFWVGSDGLATASRTGGAVVVLFYGIADYSFADIEQTIVHEYFHVLQGQLASGFEELQSGEIAYFSNGQDGPRWLMEGLAVFADYEYTPSRPEFRPFNDRYYPYENISDYRREWGKISLEEVVVEENYHDLGCAFVDDYVYAMGFAASVYLLEQAAEDSYVNYWSLLSVRPTWKQAFEQAFGIGVDDFYKGFREWLPAQLPPPDVTLRLQLRWPDMDNSRLQADSFLYPAFDEVTVVEGDPRGLLPHWASTGWFGYSEVPTIILEYREGVVGTAYVSLWWYDGDDLCTNYLLGWYKDGELTSQREDATELEFIGRTSTIDWILPGNPDTLPRVEEGRRAGC